MAASAAPALPQAAREMETCSPYTRGAQRPTAPAELRTTGVGDVRCPDPELAAALGVVDALVFRRAGPCTWAHLGGYGRGRGWAGMVKFNATLDPLAAAMHTHVGGVTQFNHRTLERVLGPCYARAGALVRLSDGVLLVLGNPTEPLAAEPSVATDTAHGVARGGTPDGPGPASVLSDAHPDGRGRAGRRDRTSAQRPPRRAQRQRSLDRTAAERVTRTGSIPSTGSTGPSGVMVRGGWTTCASTP